VAPTCVHSAPTSPPPHRSLLTSAARLVEPVVTLHRPVPLSRAHPIVVRSACTVAIEAIAGAYRAAMALAILPPAPAIGDLLYVFGDARLYGCRRGCEGRTTSCNGQDCSDQDTHHLFSPMLPPRRSNNAGPPAQVSEACPSRIRVARTIASIRRPLRLSQWLRFLGDDRVRLVATSSAWYRSRVTVRR